MLPPSLTNHLQPWVDSHAPSGLVKSDVNEKLSEKQSENVIQNSVAARVQVNVSVVHLFITILVPFFKMVIFIHFFCYLLKANVFCVVISNVFIMCVHVQKASTTFIMSVQMSVLTYQLGSQWMDFYKI